MEEELCCLCISGCALVLTAFVGFVWDTDCEGLHGLGARVMDSWEWAWQCDDVTTYTVIKSCCALCFLFPLT